MLLSRSTVFNARVLWIDLIAGAVGVARKIVRPWKPISMKVMILHFLFSTE
jgi:hypothetical protein